MKHSTSHGRHRQQRGYSLPFVLLILIMLSISLASLLFVLLSGARSTESMLGRRRLFYACDGISRIAAVSAQDYFGQTATPTSEGLREFVCTAGGGCDDDAGLLPTFVSQTPGHAVKEFELLQGEGEDKSRKIAPLDSGPFEGMIAMQDVVDMKVAVQKSSSGWRCDVTQELSLAKIAMFQFFIFSDLPYTDWSPGPPMAGMGRTHANGNICFWGDNGPLYVERVTASGKIESDDNDCFAGSDASSQGACVMVDDAAVVPGTLTQTCPTGWQKFSSRDNNDNTWREIANRAPSGSLVGFNGHLQDRAHRVPRLKLPVFGTSTSQFGIDARRTTAMSNADTSRLLVDPVRSGEDANLTAQKFAKKADLRIVDGVWYLRREDDSDSWPGDPIWSDHPGKATTPPTSIEGIAPTSKSVGQLDIAATRSWGANVRPQRFSYYTFNDAGALTRPNLARRAVISYGTLFKETGSPSVWHPGYRCTTGEVKSALLTSSSCTLPSISTVEERLLLGTRSGVRNGMAQIAFGAGASDQARSNYLPINFDVAAFQAALMDTGVGELGSIFTGTSMGVGRTFNGIVWIGSTWTGQMNPTPSAPPGQGTIADSTQPAPTTGTQAALPYPLCSDAAPGAGKLAGTAFGTTPLKVPSCVAYTDSSGVLREARATAVRVFNARNINLEFAANRPDLDETTWPAGRLPLRNGPGRDGLTIATNITTYLMGDTNLSSPEALPAAGVAQHWVPFLVAGDVVHLLSNAWDDSRSRWDTPYGTGLTGPLHRIAEPTTYHFEMLSGWAATADEPDKFSGGLHNFPRFQEDWNGIKALIRGSLVAGWYPVQTRWPWTCCDNRDYRAPNRDWGFDEHLNNILNQPPGAPLYDVQATRRWKR